MLELTVSFDTNCLNDILNDDQKTDGFVTTLSQRPEIIVSIPGYVLSELFAGTRSDRIALRIKNLLRLWDGVGDKRIQFSLEIKEMMLAELRRRQGLTPIIDPSLKKRAKKYLLDAITPTASSLSNIMKSCGEINQDKDNVLGLDKKAASFIEKKGGFTTPAAIKEVETYIEQYQLPGACVRWLFDESFDRIGWTGFRPSLEEVARSGRYKIYRLFIAMTELTMLAAAYNGKSAHELVRLFGPQKGNWYDSMIAASAARTSYLVTDDDNLAQKVNFLAERKITRLKAIPYTQFLKIN